jgi:hypothetical protein
VSGQVRLGNLIAYDKATDTRFLQETGEALDGPLAGKVLKEVSTENSNTRIRFDQWKSKYPQTLVMVDPKKPE